MSRGRNTMVGTGILGLGLVGAIPFVRPATAPPETVRRESGEVLPLRAVPLEVLAEPNQSPALGLYDDDSGARPVPAATIESGNRVPPVLDQFGPPPEFTSTYPERMVPVEPWSNRARPVSAEVKLDDEPQRRHRIIDGDTLARLARKYLGDPGRAAEIFAANRNVLTTPEILPLGVEIVIPPRD